MALGRSRPEQLSYTWILSKQNNVTSYSVVMNTDELDISNICWWTILTSVIWLRNRIKSPHAKNLSWIQKRQVCMSFSLQWCDKRSSGRDPWTEKPFYCTMMTTSTRGNPEQWGSHPRSQENIGHDFKVCWLNKTSQSSISSSLRMLSAFQIKHVEDIRKRCCCNFGRRASSWASR